MQDSAYYVRRRRGPSLDTLRNAEFDRCVADKVGTVFPDDDHGRDLLFAALHLKIPRGEGEPGLRRYMRRMAPWLGEDEAGRLLDWVFAKQYRYGADKLAELFALTDDDRRRRGIRTIGAVDVPREARLARRRASKNARRKAKRRASGMKSRAEYESASASRNRPWEAFGISRRTWERRGKPAPQSP